MYRHPFRSKSPRAGRALLAMLAFACVLLACGRVAFTAEGGETALDRYVTKPDASYSYNVVKTIPGEGQTTYIIDLKSQTWRTPDEVDRTLWEHWLIVVKPNDVKYDTAFLYITGGGNGSKPPEGAEGLVQEMARGTKSVVAELRMVPNQPLVFGNDGKKRTEDDLIAYTWDKYMTTGDETWPARLPMVKSAVRAMDTVQDLLAKPDAGKVVIDKFVVAGGSKRGWTTWLTGAVDKRVVAIIPAVIDVLNTTKSMKHHYEAYGFWAPSVGDYVRHKINSRQHLPEHAALMKIEDPYNYLHRLTMPKFLVNAAGDEFFLPDSSQFYFNDLLGEKYLRYVPNASHSLAGSDARESIEAFYQAVIDNHPRPKFSWTFESDGSIRVTTEEKPREVLLWQAANERSRDFRLASIGKAYKPTKLEPQADGSYLAKLAAPEQGFTASFVELTYDSGGRFPFKFTTAVRVLPDVLPFKDKLEEWQRREAEKIEAAKKESEKVKS